MADEAEMGWSSKLGTAASNPGSPPADPADMVEFTRDTVRLAVARQNFGGIRGTRSAPGGRELVVSRSVAGGVECQPTPKEVGLWLPRALGGTPTGTTTKTYPLAETLPYFDLFAVRGQYRFQYRECQVAAATFAAAQGGPLGLSVSVVGKDRDDPPAAASWPAGLKVDVAATPWMFYEATLTVAGTGYRFREFSLTVDNLLDTRRFLNSVTPTEFPTAGRRVSVALTRPWGASLPVLAAFRAGKAAVTLALATGTAPNDKLLTFAMPAVYAEQLDDPAVDGREEIMLPLRLAARSDIDGSNNKVNELTVTLKEA